MAWNVEKAIEYAKEAKAAVFATVSEEEVKVQKFGL